MNTTNDKALLPQEAIAHIQPQIWEQVNRLLIKKSITEFAHEHLIEPELEGTEKGWSNYLLHVPKNDIYYRFKAKKMELNHLYIQLDSIAKFQKEEKLNLDALLFIKEFSAVLGLEKERLAVYLEEITSTLYGSAYKHLKGNPLSKELVNADFQTIEQTMMEGHPGFVANNGRIGFDSGDYRAYAPEVGHSFPLLWLAGHKDRTVYAGTKELEYHQLIRHELDQETIDGFCEILQNKGLNVEDYYFIPAHPWQWFNKLSNIFAPEIAQEKLICLGYGKDEYYAQQSIRTLFNSSNPQKFYTKTALSILNMGFMRGLPIYYLGTAPQMAVWLEDLLMKDKYILETGFEMLGEIASVSYVNPYYGDLGPQNDYNRMLASLWRESPVSKIKEGQQLMTMAALLHVDQNGVAFLPELIKASGLTTDNWLRNYLKSYLSPLLHCFYQYDLVFMPHGENLILVLEDHIPFKAFLKDITEEAVILNPDVVLPEGLERMYAPIEEEVKLLSIFIDVFDGFFRYLAHILLEHANYNEANFWKLVAENILDYQARFPELNAKFEQYDLFAPDFQLSCLNRLQLNNNKRMVDLYDPTTMLQLIGRLENPIAKYRLTPKTSPEKSYTTA
ncbi:IucA/IucC family protein [Aureispira anguillae]|uniref:IucA/IucC family siderophore biosynthesis protein n=1 Tax=Aureispira anguillae TaxID=2864201 RepID=A0A915YDV9_9BACT|nr:IucA/IucC family siderophore biosynthesis protein [Aureispira anguillae]BDS11221.1 IucA/IucC family siderophore biosynthesis protein [Aureispira anguillae]